MNTKSSEQAPERKPRAHRKPYDVRARRGFWIGWYYDEHGIRHDNISLAPFNPETNRSERLPVTTADSDRCPNRIRALEYIRQIATSPVKSPKPTPNILEAISVFLDVRKLNGLDEQTTGRVAKILQNSLSGLPSTRNGRAKSGPLIQVQGLGWETFRQVDRTEFRNFLIRMQEANRAPSTRNLYQVYWKAFFDFCIGEGWLKNNPLADLEKTKIDISKMPHRPYTRDEFNRIMEVANTDQRVFFAVLAGTGFRFSEASQLRGKHLDPVAERPVWKLPKKLQKIKRQVTLPMMGSLAKLLAQRWYNVGPEGLLFPSPPSAWDLNELIRKAGVQKVNSDGERVHFHSFRYFFCTEMSRSLTMREVQYLMRHSQLAMTADLYGRFHLTEVGERLLVPEIPMNV